MTEVDVLKTPTGFAYRWKCAPCGSIMASEDELFKHIERCPLANKPSGNEEILARLDCILSSLESIESAIWDSRE